MTLSVVPLAPVEPALIQVYRLRGVATAAGILGAAAAAEWTVPWLPFPGAVLTAALLFATWSVGVAPKRRWQRIGSAFTGTELHVEQGLWTRWHTIVPVSRVQHIDIAQGVAERLCGVVTLVLHTAGTEASMVAVPGLAREEAEAIRDSIREAIGSARS